VNLFQIRRRHEHTGLREQAAARANLRLNARAAQSKSFTPTAFLGKPWNRTRIYVDGSARSSSNLGYGTFQTTPF